MHVRSIIYDSVYRSRSFKLFVAWNELILTVFVLKHEMIVLPNMYANLVEWSHSVIYCTQMSSIYLRILNYGQFQLNENARLIFLRAMIVFKEKFLLTGLINIAILCGIYY